jgi:hypothetical protein
MVVADEAEADHQVQEVVHVLVDVAVVHVPDAHREAVQSHAVVQSHVMGIQNHRLISLDPVHVQINLVTIQNRDLVHQNAIPVHVHIQKEIRIPALNQRTRAVPENVYNRKKQITNLVPDHNQMNEIMIVHRKGTMRVWKIKDK